MGNLFAVGRPARLTRATARIATSGRQVVPVKLF